jgi:transposase
MTEPAALPTAPRSRDAVRQAWVERLARFDAATLTTAQFCAAEGVSVASFYHWKRRLTPRPDDTPPADDAPRLLPVHVATPSAPLELVLPSGTILRISTDADPSTLQSLLRLLGVTPC